MSPLALPNPRKSMYPGSLAQNYCVLAYTTEMTALILLNRREVI